jgi:hypothetical protein
MSSNCDTISTIRNPDFPRETFFQPYHLIVIVDSDVTAK